MPDNSKPYVPTGLCHRCTLVPQANNVFLWATGKTDFLHLSLSAGKEVYYYTISSLQEIAWAQNHDAGGVLYKLIDDKSMCTSHTYTVGHTVDIHCTLIYSKVIGLVKLCNLSHCSFHNSFNILSYISQQLTHSLPMINIIFCDTICSTSAKLSLLNNQLLLWRQLIRG